MLTGNQEFLITIIDRIRTDQFENIAMIELSVTEDEFQQMEDVIYNP